MKTILPFLRSRHACQRRLHRQERAGEIDVERPPPVCVRGAMCRRTAGHPGVRHDDVDQSARRFRLLVETAIAASSVTSAATAKIRRASFATSASASSRRAADGHVDAGTRRCERDARPTPEPPPVTSASRPAIIPSAPLRRRARPDGKAGRGQADRGLAVDATVAECDRRMQRPSRDRRDAAAPGRRGRRARAIRIELTWSGS